MVKSPSTFALVALMAAGGMFTAPAVELPQTPPAGVQAQENARRHAATKDALLQVSKAREAYQAKRYTDAVEHYRNALSVLPKAPATAKLQKFINESLSDALIARAIDYRSVGRTDEAISFLREAAELAPDNKRAQTELVYTMDPVRTNPALTPEHIGDVEEVNRLLTLGNSYLDLGKYDQAISAFESVKNYDPYNVAATRGIERASVMKDRYYKAAHDTTKAKMLADVGKEWDEAAKTAVAPMGVTGVTQGGAGELLDSLDKETESVHAEALEQMQVDSFSLDDNTLDEALDLLRSYIKRFESRGLRSTRPIEVLSRLGDPNSPEYANLMQRRVSIQLSNLSVKEVMDEIARLYDIDYYYVPLGIEFSHDGEDHGRLVDRTFIVPSHFFDRETDEDSSDDEDDAFATAPGRMEVRRKNPVKVLKSLGINFPEGANAVYRASTRRLIVRNTLRNLAKIQELLNAPTSNQRVVVLNVVTIEMSDTHLEDLGFDWMFNMHLGGEMFAAGAVSNSVSGVTGLPTISTATSAPVGRPQGTVASSGLRSIREVSGSGGLTRLIEEGSVSNFSSSSALASPNIFGIRGVWSAADVTVMMRGLSQQKGVDILQAPRLVFDAGNEEQVSIVNVRELYYPESYEPPQIPTQRNNNNWNNNWDDDDDWDDNTTGGGGSSTVVSGAHPTEFVRYGYTEDGAGGIGSIIQIHKAEPSPDGQSINMAITSTVNEFDGFIDWGTPIYSAMATIGAAGTGINSIRKIVLSENHIFQPVFRRRVVNTAVSVENGAVLVIGGMKESRTVRYEDKIPVLGDLPLVGRFFRSSGEEKERRVLIIFAKVDIVDPTGRNVNGQDVSSPSAAPL